MESGLCQCGCGGKTTIAAHTRPDRGWVKGEPIRFIRGHQGRKLTPEYAAEDRGYETPCWIWQRSVTGSGYGYKNGKRAHRLYYERAKGPIPEGLHIDHLCGVRVCVNPDHLEPVTQAENNRRAAKLTEADREIIRAASGQNFCKGLAERFGVSINTVYTIRSPGPGSSYGAI